MADNKKIREKNKKDAAAVKKKQQDYQNERKGKMVQVAEAHKSLLERANKAIQDGNSEQAKGLKERASHFAKILNGDGRKLSNDYLKNILDASEQQDLDSKQNLDLVRQAIEKQTAEDIKATRRAEAMAAGAPISKGLSSLSENIAIANAAEVAREKLGRNELGQRLKDLGNVFGKAASKADIERAKELKEQYTKVAEALETAKAGGNEEEIALAQQQVDALDDTVSSEEQRREQTKKADEANSILVNIRSNVEGFNSKLGDMAKGGGFVAGLAGIVLALFSPETFVKIVNTAIEKVMVIVDFITKLFEKDLSGAFETFKENLGLFAAIAGGILLFFGPALINGLIAVVNVVKTVGLFMKVTMFPAITAMFTAIATAFSSMLVAMTPFLIPILVVVAIIGAIVGTVMLLRNSLGEGATMMDGLLLGWSYIKDGFARVKNMFLTLAESIISGLDWINPILKFLGKAPIAFNEIKFERAATDNAQKFREGQAERVAERKREEAEAKLEAARQSKTAQDSAALEAGMLGFNSSEATAAYEAAMSQVNSGKMSGTTQVNAAQSTNVNSSNVVHVNTNGAQSSRALQLPALGY